jgi:hypothetical protein
MIITTKRHGRTRRQAGSLLRHLSKQEGQRSRVVAIEGAPVSTPQAALNYMQAMRDGSRARVAFHHIVIAPSRPLTDDQRDEAVRIVLLAMGAQDHAHALWEHAEKPRRGSDVDTHYHLVVGHVGPDGKALHDSRSFVKLEAAARVMEVDFDHPLTASRRTHALAAELERMERPDIAARVLAAQSSELPRSAMSSRSRARAERAGIALPHTREAVREAWERSDSAAAFRHAVAEAGLAVSPGDKAGVWVVSQGGIVLGALDRFLRQPRRAVDARMKEEGHDAAATSHAGSESRLQRKPQRPGGRRTVGPAPVAPGAAGAGRAKPHGRLDRSPDNRRPDAARNAPRDRSAGRPDRGASLAAPRMDAAHSPPQPFEFRRIRRTARARAIIDARRLARVNLDDLLRMAEEAGRRTAELVARMLEGRNEAEALRARIRAVSSSTSTNRRARKPIQRDSQVGATSDPSKFETFPAPRR